MAWRNGVSAIVAKASEKAKSERQYISEEESLTKRKSIGVVCQAMAERNDINPNGGRKMSEAENNEQRSESNNNVAAKGENRHQLAATTTWQQ